MRKARKSICFIVTSPLTANAFLIKHFEVLADRYDVYLIANFESFSFVGTSYLKGTFDLKINRKISPLRDLKCIFILTAYLSKMNFDAVHTVTPKAGLIGMLSARLAFVKNRIHIFTGQVWFTRKGIVRYVLILLDKLISLLATKILVDSHSQRAFLISENIISEKKSMVLGKGSISGVSLSKFLPDKSLRLDLRQQLGFKKDAIVFGFLGRLTRDKGIIDLARAFSDLKAKHNNIELFFIGMDEEDIADYIYRNIGQEGIRFYGHSNEPAQILQACDIFCMPSYREGFGTSIIEASLMELPVICSDTYGLYDTIIDNETGLRHEVGSVDDLKRQMEKLIIEPALQRKMGHAGSNYVKNNFSDEMISQEWLAFYHNLLTSTERE